VQQLQARAVLLGERNGVAQRTLTEWRAVDWDEDVREHSILRV
jgi:hypothetical protein